MKSFQDLVLSRIEEYVAANAMFGCTQSHDWANTGWINIHVSHWDEEAKTANLGVTPVARVHYEFQAGTYKLSLEVQGKGIPSQEGRADYFDFYQDNNASTRFWLVFRRELDALEKRFA